MKPCIILFTRFYARHELRGPDGALLTYCDDSRPDAAASLTRMAEALNLTVVPLNSAAGQRIARRVEAEVTEIE